MKEEEILQAQERMRALEREVRKGVDEQRRVNAEHVAELNHMDQQHYAVVKSLRAEVGYLEGKVAQCEEIMNDVNIERLQKKMEQNAATARFVSCLEGCLVRQKANDIGRQLCLWLWYGNYQEDKDLHEARKSILKRMSHILSLWRYGAVTHVWSGLVDSFRFDKLMQTRFRAGEATLLKMKKRMDQIRCLSAVLGFKSNKNAEQEAAAQVSAVRAEMLEMEKDATFTIEKLEEDKATLVANLTTLEATLETMAETGDMAATMQSLTRQLAEVQTEVALLERSQDKTVREAERVQADAKREIARERQHASDSVYELQAEINALKSEARRKDRELERTKEDFEFTVQRMARTSEVRPWPLLVDGLVSRH